MRPVELLAPKPGHEGDALYAAEDLFQVIRAAHDVGGDFGASKKLPPRNPDEAGGRNNYLTSQAGKLRGMGYRDQDLEEALLIRNRGLDDPLPEHEVRDIAQHVSRYERPAKAFATTDAGNAERFATRNPDLRYLPEKDRWVSWDGTRWAEDQRGTIAGYQVLQAVRSIPREEAALPDVGLEERDALTKWAKASESADKLAAALRIAKTLPDVKALVTDFDSDPWILNVQNGILDLRTGELRKHNRAARCSKMAQVVFVAGAEHECLYRYLAQATGGDPEFIAFLRRAMGYTLTGDVSAESLFLVLGPGGAGKTTLVEAFKDLLGDYALTTAAKTLLEKKGEGGHSSDIARMHGRRMIATSEIPKGKRLDAGLVKSLTGGERIVARNIWEADSEFQPAGKYWLAANHAPGVDDDDSGMWRRIIRIPFTRVLPESERDPAVKATLRSDPAARSALLWWALQGCLEWQQKGGGRVGLGVPAVVKDATEKYKEEQNPIRGFLEECCELRPNAECAVSSIKREYAEWCRASCVKPVGPHELNDRLTSAGCCQVVVKGEDRKSYKAWRGISIIAETVDKTVDTQTKKLM